MRTRWLAGLLALFAAATLPAQEGLVEEPVLLRIDSVHEVLKGSIANPFDIGLGPDGTVRIGKPVYVRAAFKPLKGDPRIKPRDRVKVRQVLQADRVAITVLFPHADPDKKPIAAAGWLRPDFCCGKGLDGTFAIPEQARRGPVELRVSWPASGSLRAGSTILDAVVAPPQE